MPDAEPADAVRREPADQEAVTLQGVNTRKSTARELLREAGLRSTRPRLRVLEQLERVTTPVSHGELVQELETKGMDRTTVYRNLLDLTDAGLVRRSDLGDHVWRFELKREEKAHQGTHPHFTCTDCGSVACLPAESVRLTSAKGAPRSVAARSVDIQLRGLCDRCC